MGKSITNGHFQQQNRRLGPGAVGSILQSPPRRWPCAHPTWKLHITNTTWLYQVIVCIYIYIYHTSYSDMYVYIYIYIIHIHYIHISHGIEWDIWESNDNWYINETLRPFGNSSFLASPTGHGQKWVGYYWVPQWQTHLRPISSSHDIPSGYD